jgi:hypothetical protein
MRRDKVITTNMLRELHGKITKVKMGGPSFDERNRRLRWVGYNRPDGKRYIAEVRFGREPAILSDNEGDTFRLWNAFVGVPPMTTKTDVTDSKAKALTDRLFEKLARQKERREATRRLHRLFRYDMDRAWRALESRHGTHMRFGSLSAPMLDENKRRIRFYNFALFDGPPPDAKHIGNFAAVVRIGRKAEILGEYRVTGKKLP